MKPITMTVYLFADEGENTSKWNVQEWLDDPTVGGWEITEGHPDNCPGCADVNESLAHEFALHMGED